MGPPRTEGWLSHGCTEGVLPAGRRGAAGAIDSFPGEDEQTISALLPGCLEDIQVNIDAAQEKMSRQNEEQDTPAQQADGAA